MVLTLYRTRHSLLVSAEFFLYPPAAYGPASPRPRIVNFVADILVDGWNTAFVLSYGAILSFINVPFPHPQPRNSSSNGILLSEEEPLSERFASLLFCLGSDVSVSMTER